MKEKATKTTYTITNNKEMVPQVIDWLEKFCHGHKIDKDTTQLILLATDEAITNIILYAYPVESYGKIHISFEIAEETLIIEMINYGKPFKPLNIFERKRKNVNKLKIGGYGLMIMHAFMDDLNFQYKQEDNSNRLCMKKHISRRINT